MKNLKHLSYLMCICLLVIFVSCSQEESIELNQEIRFEKSHNKGSKVDKLMIRMIYDFSPGMTEFEKRRMKDNRRDYLGQFFTIYSARTSTNCERIEYWIVNSQEYNWYLITQPDKGTSNAQDEDEMQETPYNLELNEECPRARREPIEIDASGLGNGLTIDYIHDGQNEIDNNF